MTQSWIRSRKNPESLPIRDEGQAHEPATYAKLPDGSPGALLTPEILAREAWPEGHAVYIKDRVTAGDTALARKLLASRSIKIGEELSDGGPEVAWYLGSLTSCAVMITHVEGEHFIDPDTGALLDFSGGPYERLAAAQELPNFVVEYVGSEIDKLSDVGFRPKKNATPSAIAAEVGSTTDLKRPSRKSGARA